MLCFSKQITHVTSNSQKLYYIKFWNENNILTFFLKMFIKINPKKTFLIISR